MKVKRVRVGLAMSSLAAAGLTGIITGCGGANGGPVAGPRSVQEIAAVIGCTDPSFTDVIGAEEAADCTTPDVRIERYESDRVRATLADAVADYGLGPIVFGPNSTVISCDTPEQARVIADKLGGTVH